MASSSIKGLTIEIGASTQKFTTAMKELQSEAMSISKDLKTVNENLKLDPDNVGKTADKLKLLQDAANNAAKKVSTIKAGIEALNKQYDDKSSKEYTEQMSKLEKQLASAQREQDLANEKVKAFKTAATDAGGGASRLGDIIKGNLISNVIIKGLTGLANVLKSVAQFAINAVKNVANFAKETVDMAADYQDALGYSEKVFGDFTERVQEWVTKNSGALRLNVSELQTYVNNIGSLYRSFGIDEEKAASLAEMLIDRAADLKSATGKDLQSVLDSLTSVLTGGYKAGYQFGIVINEATIKAKALSEGLVETEVDLDKVSEAMLKQEKAAKKLSDATIKYGEDSLQAKEAQMALDKATESLEEALGGETLALTQAQKEQAIFKLILEQTSHVAGQNADEAKNYKSQLDLLKTTIDNIKISIGDRLLPVFEKVVTKINQFMETEEFSSLMNTIYDTISNISDSVLELIESGQVTTFISNLQENLPHVSEKISEMGTKIAESIDGIWDLITGIQTLWDNLTNRGGHTLDDLEPGRRYGMAAGGPVKAGQIYQVNDDAGHRNEFFIPNTNGYILNGNQTERIINNSSSQNFSGGINVYVNSYGTNVAEVADELGQAIQNKLRMSGAML